MRFKLLFFSKSVVVVRGAIWDFFALLLLRGTKRKRTSGDQDWGQLILSGGGVFLAKMRFKLLLFS